MSKDVQSNVISAAKTYFGSISKEGWDGFFKGVESEVTRTAEKLGSDDIEIIEPIGTLIKTARMVKKAGVFPYYIICLAAAALYSEAKEEAEIADAIALKGVRSAVEDLYELSMEPELSYMISDAYACILKGNLFCTDERKIELMRTAYEHGFYNEATYHGCAQCTIKAFYDTIGSQGKEQDYLFKAASGMAGGITCCIDSACGGYSGANLIIGTYVGRTLDSLGKEGSSAKKSHELGRFVHDKFIEVYGSTICKDLHTCKFGRSYNLRDPEEAQAFHNAGAHDEYCPTTVGLASSWLVEVLFDQGLIK